MESSSPLVSIITPTYNHGKYIAACIRSVQSQSYANWEMLIINDGSTDDTAEVVTGFLDSDPRIKLYNQKNIGIFRLKETYDFGLSRSQGKYIAILEGDDLWEPGKLQRQVTQLENNSNIVLAWGKVQSVKDDLSEVYAEHPSCKASEMRYYANDPPGSLLNLLYIENCIPALTIFTRKECLTKLGGFLQPHGLPLVDLPTLLELATMGGFYFDDTILGKWRIYSGQVTKKYPVEIIKGRFECAKSHFSKIPEVIRKNIKLNEDDIRSYFNNIIHIGYARAGRYKLIQKNFREARKDYIAAIFYKGTGNFMWRIRAMIGYIFSLFNLNIEWLAKLLGKKTYSGS